MTPGATSVTSVPASSCSCLRGRGLVVAGRGVLVVVVVTVLVIAVLVIAVLVIVARGGFLDAQGVSPEVSAGAPNSPAR